MNFQGFDKKSTLIHTKISTEHKKQIEQIAAENSVDENIVFNTALANGLRNMTTPAKVVKKK